MNEQLQLANASQSIRLKNAGFDWKTNHYYLLTGDGKYELNRTLECLNHNGVDTKFERFSAPTIALALKWFRDVKNIVSSIYLGNCCYIYQYVFKDNSKAQNAANITTKKYQTCGRECYYQTDNPTYEEAEIPLLDELLTILEELSE